MAFDFRQLVTPASLAHGQGKSADSKKLVANIFAKPSPELSASDCTEIGRETRTEATEDRAKTRNELPFYPQIPSAHLPINNLR